jgi:hypothetical protein
VRERRLLRHERQVRRECRHVHEGRHLHQRDVRASVRRGQGDVLRDRYEVLHDGIVLRHEQWGESRYVLREREVVHGDEHRLQRRELPGLRRERINLL